jgi:hypothetical protein
MYIHVVFRPHKNTWKFQLQWVKHPKLLRQNSQTLSIYFPFHAECYIKNFTIHMKPNQRSNYELNANFENFN